jgi:hypothetical protein
MDVTEHHLRALGLECPAPCLQFSRVHPAVHRGQDRRHGRLGRGVAIGNGLLGTGEIEQGDRGLRFDQDARVAGHGIIRGLGHDGLQLAHQVVLIGWGRVVGHVAPDDVVRQEGLVHHVAREIVVHAPVHHQMTVHADGLEVERIAHAGPHGLGQIALGKDHLLVRRDVRGHAAERHEKAVQVVIRSGGGTGETPHLLIVDQYRRAQVGGQRHLQRSVHVHAQGEHGGIRPGPCLK